MLDRFKKVDVQDLSEQSMEAAAPKLSQRQREQLLEGKNALGEKVGRYRNPQYARMKNAMNPKPGYGVPDLKLSGNFHKGIYTDVRGDTIITDSTDTKTQKLADKYGEEIFGLSEEKKNVFIKEDLHPVFMEKIKQQTGL